MAQIDFIKVCLQSNMFEYGPTKGTIFFTPNSFFIWTKIQTYLDERFQKIGVENVQFPSLIPYAMFAKESEHISGFKPEIFLVENAGEKKLSQKLVLRPTSEVIFCYYFQKVLKSYRDLPIILNQWGNVWRYEQNPNPFLRNMEFLWNEGHTLHFSANEAIDFCYKILNIYRDCLQKKLLIPVFLGYKSESEKFAGAKKTWALETILPDGQFLQLATVHYFGEEFVESFNIQFLNKNNKKQIPFQTSWGISTRVIAGLIQTHCDEKGLILPFCFAKKQIWILPINFKQIKAKDTQGVEIDNYCELLEKKLGSLNYKVKLWKRSEINKNFKYYCSLSEKKGIPIRIEIGYKELKEKTITFVTRYNSLRQTLSWEEFFKNFEKIYQQMDLEIYQQASENILNKIVKINNFESYLSQKKDKIFQVWFCNEIICEAEIKKITGTVSRILWKDLNKNGNCFKCEKKTLYQAFFGRSY